MKIYSKANIPLESHVNSFITVNVPSSGFSLMFGCSTGESHFNTGFGFSGYSGYLFDNEGSFFGGYSSGISFNIDAHIFRNDRRISYSYNDVLIKNSLALTSPLNCVLINCIEFDKIGDSSADIQIYNDSDSFLNLKDLNGISLISFDNMILGASIK